MAKSIRRIVTGHDQAGKSIFLSDAPIEPFPDTPPHADYFEIWNTASDPAPISAVEPKEPTDRPRTTAPGAHGSVIRFVDFLPGMTPRHTPDAARPGMHRTESIDYAICIEGEMWAILDDSETLMKAGDVLIQRGTDHAWRNRSDKTARMLFILQAGKFDEALAKTFSLKTLMA